MCNHEARTLGTTTAVYCRVTTVNNIFQEQYNDFSIMTGSQIIRETNVEDILKGELDVEEFIATVDEIRIGKHTTLISGFSNRNENMYEIAKRDAQAKYTALEAQYSEAGIAPTDLYELKKRISKLRGKMGIIHVGGNSSMEKSANYDLVEDAVKACESAYSYGYNVGGSLIIPLSIGKILQKPDFKETFDKADELIFKLIHDAFILTFKAVLTNKYTKESDATKVGVIVQGCLANHTCYDLNTDQYSNDVINPCFTDIEILKAAISIIGLVVTSNQYITIYVNEEQAYAQNS